MYDSDDENDRTIIPTSAGVVEQASAVIVPRSLKRKRSPREMVRTDEVIDVSDDDEELVSVDPNANALPAPVIYNDYRRVPETQNPLAPCAQCGCRCAIPGSSRGGSGSHKLSPQVLGNILGA